MASVAPIRSYEPSRSVEVTRLAATVGAVAAFASGLIHLAVIRHHLEFATIIVGFALISAAQFVFALRMLTQPSPHVRVAGLTLHAVVVLTWLASRTTGLPAVAGAEEPSSVGVSDAIATGLSLVVIGSLVWVSALGRRPHRPCFSPRAAHRVTAAAAAIAVGLAVPAVTANHDHARHDQGVDDPVGHEHGLTGDEHEHDHGHGQ